jgi:hypothetical protein
MRRFQGQSVCDFQPGIRGTCIFRELTGCIGEKSQRFALAMKVEGMPLPNPAVDGANSFPLSL